MRFQFAVIQLHGIDMRMRIHHTFLDRNIDDWSAGRDTLNRADTLTSLQSDTIGRHRFILNDDRATIGSDNVQVSLSLFFDSSTQMIDSVFFDQSVTQIGAPRSYFYGSNYRLIAMHYDSSFAGISAFKQLNAGDTTLEAFQYYRGLRSNSNFTSLNDSTDLTLWQCKRIEGFQPGAFISIALIP